MNAAHRAALDDLLRKGWDVRLRSEPRPIPEDVKRRYGWIPRAILSFVEGVESAVSPDSRAWFVTSADMAAESEAAFCWNQWEIDSLAAAGSDAQWQQAIRSFWDQHFPVLLSVKSGYAFFAVQQQGLTIVRGEEPEYEGTTVVAKSLTVLLKMLCAGDPRLARWI